MAQSTDIQQFVNEMRSLLREENDRILEKLEPRIRDLEIKLAEYKEHISTNKRFEENFVTVNKKLEALENFRWMLVGGGLAASTIAGIIGSYLTKLIG